MNLKKIKSKNFWLVFLGLSLFGCFLFCQTTSAQGTEGTEPGWLSMGTGWLLVGVNVILYGLYSLVLSLFGLSTWLLDQVISPKLYSDVFFSPVARAGINTAWSFVRDFFNLFFILIIVLIGLSVILGVSKFKDKAMLFRVIFAAMLINFSKPITLFVIDFSNVFMNFFAESITKMNFGAQMARLINFESITGTAHSGFENNFAYFVIIIVVMVMLIIMTTMLFYIAVSLIIRLIAFWVLIILSPIAMFGLAMEGTKLSSMKDEWTKNLIGWCFYGPIFLFFLWLTLILTSAISGSIDAGSGGFSSVLNIENLKAGSNLSRFFSGLAKILIPYITAIYLLFYGYDKAKSFSEGAATKILDAGSKKLSDWGTKARHQVTLPGTREAIGEGLKARVDNYEGPGQWVSRRLTETGRKDLQAQKNAEWKGGILGGQKGAEREYYRGKAQETLKNWKNDPPSNVRLEEMFKSKKEEERLAATLYKSENNQLGFDDKGNNLYKSAMKNLEGHDGLKDRITKEAKKENLAAVIDYSLNDRLEQETGFGGKLLNVNPESDVYKNRVKEIRTGLYEKELKGNLGSILKGQNQDIYDQEGVLEFLYEKNKGTTSLSRRKLAQNIKNTKVSGHLREKGVLGRYLMGEETRAEAAALEAEDAS